MSGRVVMWVFVPSQLSLNRKWKCVRQSMYFKCAVATVPVSPGCWPRVTRSLSVKPPSVDEWAKWCGPWLIRCLRNMLRSLVHALWNTRSFTLCSLRVRSDPLEIAMASKLSCQVYENASRWLRGKGEVNRRCTISHHLSPSFLIPHSARGWLNSPVVVGSVVGFVWIVGALLLDEKSGRLV